MANINLQITGLDTLMNYLHSRPREFKEAIRRILSVSIQAIERESKQVTPVDTGRLRATIGGGTFEGGAYPAGYGVTMTETQASIGPLVDYALFVHNRVPFMLIGAEKATDKITEAVIKEINAAINA